MMLQTQLLCVLRSVITLHTGLVWCPLCMPIVFDLSFVLRCGNRQQLLIAPAHEHLVAAPSLEASSPSQCRTTAHDRGCSACLRRTLRATDWTRGTLARPAKRVTRLDTVFIRTRP